jgi:hypothetical protein
VVHQTPLTSDHRRTCSTHAHASPPTTIWHSFHISCSSFDTREHTFILHACPLTIREHPRTAPCTKSLVFSTHLPTHPPTHQPQRTCPHPSTHIHPSTHLPTYPTHTHTAHRTPTLTPHTNTYTCTHVRTHTHNSHISCTPHFRTCPKCASRR